MALIRKQLKIHYHLSRHGVSNNKQPYDQRNSVYGVNTIAEMNNVGLHCGGSISKKLKFLKLNLVYVYVIIFLPKKMYRVEKFPRFRHTADRPS